jgi:hypothetical protein
MSARSLTWVKGTPSHALMYVRYSAAGWQGDMDLPPQPLVPYAEW